MINVASELINHFEAYFIRSIKNIRGLSIPNTASSFTLYGSNPLSMTGE
jgi:hypothetical protein